MLKIVNKILCEECGEKYLKLLLSTNDNYVIEELIGNFLLSNNGLIKALGLANNRRKHTFVCLSTQIGCPLNCKFCANRNLNFIRNLQIFEIVEEITLAQSIAKHLLKSPINEIQFGGVGEPLLNLSNIIKSIELISKFNDNIFFIFSTTGYPILKLSKLTESLKSKNLKNVFLQLSLHASNDQIRKKLMGIGEINKVFKKLRQYISLVASPVIINYLLIKNLNDSDKNAHELGSLITKDIKENVIIKLSIPNYTGNHFSMPSPAHRVDSFSEILKSYDIKVVLFKSGGRSIFGGCGQLITRRIQKWQSSMIGIE